MTIKTKRKGDKLYITLIKTVKGVDYQQTYTCSLDEAEEKFKEFLKGAISET